MRHKRILLLFIDNIEIAFAHIIMHTEIYRWTDTAGRKWSLFGQRQFNNGNIPLFSCTIRSFFVSNRVCFNLHPSLLVRVQPIWIYQLKCVQMCPSFNYLHSLSLSSSFPLRYVASLTSLCLKHCLIALKCCGSHRKHYRVVSFLLPTHGCTEELLRIRTRQKSQGIV